MSGPALPAGLRIYAIGDIHGRADLLERLGDKIAEDLQQGGFREAATVLLGDYIDRELGSAQVLERLAGARFPTPIVALRGNHEQQMLDFLERPDVLRDWRRQGGLATLASYGVDAAAAMSEESCIAARDELERNLPASHREFLAATRTSWSVGDYFFCHAGARPGVPLDRQQDLDLLWIRDEFISSSEPFEKMIVHGHSPARAPIVLPHRIGIDTGAYFTGVLTCVVLQAAERRFLST